MEQTQEVKPIRTNYICDTCKEGIMYYQSSAPQCCGPSCKKPHKCGKCGATQKLDKIYPFISYQAVTNATSS